MRPLVDRARLDALLEAMGREDRGPARVYLVGGATALLRGWRESTIDVDLRIEPDSAPLLRSFPELKRRLDISLELASPVDFLPELPGWRERSRFLRREGSLDVFEFDWYSQALAKIERGFEQDLGDVRRMFAEGLVQGPRLLELLARIEPELYRFPAVDPDALREDVERAVKEFGGGEST